MTVIRALTPSDEAERKRPRGERPKVGSVVGLWQIDSHWYVWSEGSDAGTWWLMPYTERARAIYDTVKADSEQGSPVVRAALQGAILVTSKDIKPGAWV